MGGEQMILEPTAWNNEQKQAGINSFGFGGTNAHMVVLNHLPETAQGKKEATPEHKAMAIIGMDTHFGDCEGLEEFYQTIFKGRQHFREIPAQRWKGFDANEELLKAYGFEDGKAPKGAYIEDFEIDLLRYKIQPQEAETLEPQQALILKVADQALKDAGLKESQNVAVLIAMESELSIHHYLARWDMSWQLKAALEKHPQLAASLSEEAIAELEATCKNLMYHREGSQSPSQHTSFVGNIMASRIAALWDFNGPAFTVSCGEQSAFRALEIARNMLSQNEVDAVVVGAVDFSGGLENVLLRQKDHPLNQNENPSISWNQKDEGWLIGEGAAAIVLKRQDQISDEKVYAVIDDIAPAKQVANIGLLEIAGTGIAAEDKAELQQILQTESIQDTAIGCVKANIGHSFAASGLAALIKSTLCLHHK
ncbi:MAG: beta-ketoacyl synthase N-terminal-like domain-containing protein, partial [Bacteroidota bacterium]